MPWDFIVSKARGTVSHAVWCLSVHIFWGFGAVQGVSQSGFQEGRGRALYIDQGGEDTSFIADLTVE